MNKDLEYYMKLPYTAVLEKWDDGNGEYWVARVIELPHCLIHGDTPAEAASEIEDVKRDWIQSNLERGIKIPEPTSKKYSGKLSLRIPTSLHEIISRRAALEGVSINQYMTAALGTYVNVEDDDSIKRTKKTNSRLVEA
ncbi:type II toxin-antitoxin system HicB family antitoxin [Chloroflexota bacterium]